MANAAPAMDVRFESKMEIEFHYLALIALATSFVVGGISQALSKRTRRVNYIPVVAVFLVSFGLMAFGGMGFLKMSYHYYSMEVCGLFSLGSLPPLLTLVPVFFIELQTERSDKPQHSTRAIAPCLTPHPEQA